MFDSHTYFAVLRLTVDTEVDVISYEGVILPLTFVYSTRLRCTFVSDISGMKIARLLS